MDHFLLLEDVSKRFGERLVLKEVNLGLPRGETLVLLGPSGSGKTTLLRIVAGLETPSRGRVVVDGEDLTPLPPARRRLGMVFQHFALFPHLSVGENVAFGLRGGDLTGEQGPERVEEMLELVDLADYSDRQIHQISGGQQQRIALARALAPRPRVLLLDEPLSNLDPALRERTRHQIRQIVTRIGITAVWVTHEQEEAFEVGDRVALLHEGRLQQLGTPEQLYDDPVNPFVAAFVGRSSWLEGRAAGGNRVQLSSGDSAVEWPARGGDGLHPGAPVLALVRPEQLRLRPAGDSGTLGGTVENCRFVGHAHLLAVRLDGEERVEVAARRAVEPGSPAGVALRSEAAPPLLFPRAGRSR